VRLLAFWAFIIFLTAIGEGTVRTFFNVLLDTGFGVAPASIGLIMGAAQVLPFVVALAVPLLLTRWGAGRTLFAGLLGLVLCLMLFAAGSYFGVRVPGSVGTALGIIGAAYLALAAALAVVRASRNLFGQELVAPRWRTSSQGAGALGLAFGVAVAGTAGGAIVTAVGFSAMFAAGALVTLISALCLYGYLQRSARHHAAPTLPQPAGRA
jgi:MFS family permease